MTTSVHSPLADRRDLRNTPSCAKPRPSTNFWLSKFDGKIRTESRFDPTRLVKILAQILAIAPNQSHKLGRVA